MDNEKYIRVATTLYKIVRKPLLSGDFYEMRIPWNYETLRQDQSKDFISQIEKYDGFCCIPNHSNYQRSIGNFLNDYEPIPVVPSPGSCPNILQLWAVKRKVKNMFCKHALKFFEH